jgi:hypothetical protein
VGARFRGDIFSVVGRVIDLRCDDRRRGSRRAIHSPNKVTDLTSVPRVAAGTLSISVALRSESADDDATSNDDDASSGVPALRCDFCHQPANDPGPGVGGGGSRTAPTDAALRAL